MCISITDESYKGKIEDTEILWNLKVVKPFDPLVVYREREIEHWLLAIESMGGSWSPIFWSLKRYPSDIFSS